MGIDVGLYRVGGCVRDRILGRPTKDIDFAVETSSYEDMRDWMISQNFRIWQEQPQFLTIRAQFPYPSEGGGKLLNADFVLCRKDRPGDTRQDASGIEPGSIIDDLARRDFKMNALAENVETEELLDPHGGVADIYARRISTVGPPIDRLNEDPVRMLRAVRFAVILDFRMDHMLQETIRRHAHDLMERVNDEGIQRELTPAFACDTGLTFRVLSDLNLLDLAFPPQRPIHLKERRVWMKPVLESR